jgi:hypothetical protein
MTKKQVIQKQLKKERKSWFGRLYNKKVKHGDLYYWAIEQKEHLRELNSEFKGKGPGQ